jgi:hypothetical protein
MGRVLLHQNDGLAAGSAKDITPAGISTALQSWLAASKVSCDRIRGSGKCHQLSHGGGWGHRQQKATSWPQTGQAIGGLQQKRHPHLKLGPLRTRQKGDPFPLSQGGIFRLAFVKICH